MQNHHGFLVIDKPTGLTSRDVVNRALTWFPRGTRIGHTGTLDPLATGVLVLGVGEGTRLTELVQDMDKVYRAGILLGAVSDTDDADGQVAAVATFTAAPPSQETMRAELARLIGTIEQVPPNFSAIKVTGRRAYDLARRGDKVVLAGRQVRIYGINQLHYAYPHLDIEVRCGKGTYIRSLARDLGQRLGCGGLIASLRRLRVGPFTAELAVSLEGPDRPALLPLAMAAADLPALTLAAPQIQYLRQGRGVSLDVLRVAHLKEETTVALFNDANVLVGLGKIARGELRPMRMLA